MKKNIGSTERIIRGLAGLGILSLAFVGPHSPWGYLRDHPTGNGPHRLVSALCSFRDLCLQELQVGRR